jgi:hypothetical protein
MSCTCCDECKAEKAQRGKDAKDALDLILEERPTGYYVAPMHSCPYYPYAWNGILPPPCLICVGNRAVTTGINVTLVPGTEIVVTSGAEDTP